MTGIDVLETLATVLGLWGAYLVSKPGRWFAWGFVLWLVSNPLAMVFMAIHGHWRFFAVHGAYLAMAGHGAWHWLVRPRLQGRARS